MSTMEMNSHDCPDGKTCKGTRHLDSSISSDRRRLASGVVSINLAVCLGVLIPSMIEGVIDAKEVGKPCRNIKWNKVTAIQQMNHGMYTSVWHTVELLVASRCFGM